MVRFRCKVCRRRVNIRPILIRGGHDLLFKCPLCLSQGIFRNKDFVPFLFVKKITLASRQYFAVLNPSRLRLSDVGFSFKPPTINSISPRRQNNRNIIKGIL